MATLLSQLPAPIHQVTVEDFEDEVPTPATDSSAPGPAKSSIPPYGGRRGWKPKTAEDFGDGGAYPECNIAQYPLDMGRKKHSSSGNMLALTVDGDGKIDYTKIATQGHRDGRVVQAQFKDLVPLAHRTDISAADRAMDRPSEDEVMSTTEKTRLALEKLTNGKIKSAQPKHVPDGGGDVSYIRYTPNAGGAGGATAGGSQRIIRMQEVVEDPLEPPRHKGKKIPRGPPSPPAPVLRSPPRKVTAQEQKDWMIPPCISNWKNNKGYTIPLDKRLAADGRGLQDVHINDRFAQFSEALFVADRHAREEVRQRSLMQQRIAAKEKEKKEDSMRELAQRAREERSGLPSAAAPRISDPAAMPNALAGYGSDSDDANSQASTQDGRPAARGGSDGEDEGEDGVDAATREAVRLRDEQRAERRRDREREMRMNNMGNEKRAQMLARQQNRDISEKVALGLAKPTLSKEAMVDSRLYNQEQLTGSFGDDESYALYDRPLFSGSSAAAAIYKSRGALNAEAGDDEAYGGGTEEGIGKQLKNDRFGLGVAGRGFEGADLQDVREGPVQFERDTADPFAIDAFLDEATKKGANKRGPADDDEAGEGGAKRWKS